MDANTVNAIKEALAPIAEKIGQGAAYTWEVILRQQYVNAVDDFIWSVIMFVLMGVAIKLCLKQIALKKADIYSDWQIGASIAGFFAVVLFIVGAGWIDDGVLHLINPSYYALQFFLNLGKPN